MMKRATPARLRIVDALNRGFDGDHHDLAQLMFSEFDMPKKATLAFLDVLDKEGFLSDTAPATRDEQQTAGASAEAGSDDVVVATPLSLIADSGLYCWYSHEGKLLLRLTLPELYAVSIFVEPIPVAEARSRYLDGDYPGKLGPDHFDSLVAQLAGAGLFCKPRKVRQADSETALFATVDRKSLQSLVDARVAAHDERVAEQGQDRVQVVPVNTVHGTTPASLGLLVAYAIQYDGGRLQEKYDFVPMFLTDEPRISERARKPGIFLFSNYVWNAEENLQLSRAVKAANPGNITIHGGPNTPAYEKDCEAFFAEHPHVDITVRGEGELTLSDILDKLQFSGAGIADLDVLRDVPGLTYRTPTGPRRNGDRERIPDLDTIPSPYLTGLFDEFAAVRSSAIIETNRGCPYGCTFCDWGSNTLSKVRRFSLDRVYAELEWSARHRVEDASIADANFGMLKRDVEITEKIAELRNKYGYPNTVGLNYAKNQVRYLREIIRILADAGILAEGKLSFQSRDEATLAAIDRSNIKLSQYNELAKEFRQARLPMGVELMMGLPGSNMQAFRNDLQQCTDRDLRVQVAPTQLLPNSPMNAPSYREKHGIIAKAGEYVRETATFTREDWEEMMRLRSTYFLLDTYGMARYVARYVRGETGMLEIDFYDRIRTESTGNPSRWPVLSRSLKTLEHYMAPIGSWGFFTGELKDFVVSVLDMPDDSGLRTALAVQLAHLPAADRKFPLVLELEHDFAAWWSAMMMAREAGHRDDWHQHIPRLSEYGPASITITDPNRICDLEVGKTLGTLNYSLRTWELDSPVARARNLMAVRQG